MTVDLRGFVEDVLRIVSPHALGEPGTYRRTTLPGRDETGAPRYQGPNPYGCADAANLLYTLGHFPGGAAERFADVDWAYALSRALRQTSHRFEEGRRALASFAEELAAYLLGLDPERDEGLDDLHRLFGAVCVLAELQQAAPGVLRTDRPLRLVLDRRPFI